jgi:hypothetical protein
MACASPSREWKVHRGDEADRDDDAAAARACSSVPRLAPAALTRMTLLVASAGAAAPDARVSVGAVVCASPTAVAVAEVLRRLLPITAACLLVPRGVQAAAMDDSIGDSQRRRPAAPLTVSVERAPLHPSAGGNGAASGVGLLQRVRGALAAARFDVPRAPLVAAGGSAVQATVGAAAAAWWWARADAGCPRHGPFRCECRAWAAEAFVLAAATCEGAAIGADATCTVEGAGPATRRLAARRGDGAACLRDRTNRLATAARDEALAPESCTDSGDGALALRRAVDAAGAAIDAAAAGLVCGSPCRDPVDADSSAEFVIVCSLRDGDGRGAALMSARPWAVAHSARDSHPLVVEVHDETPLADPPPPPLQCAPVFLLAVTRSAALAAPDASCAGRGGAIVLRLLVRSDSLAHCFVVPTLAGAARDASAAGSCCAYSCVAQREVAAGACGSDGMSANVHKHVTAAALAIADAVRCAVRFAQLHFADAARWLQPEPLLSAVRHEDAAASDAPRCSWCAQLCDREWPEKPPRLLASRGGVACCCCARRLCGCEPSGCDRTCVECAAPVCPLCCTFTDDGRASDGRDLVVCHGCATRRGRRP